MSTELLVKNEFHRILELSELNLDYSDLQKYLQDLAELAAKIANTQISLVNLIDSYTQWTVSRSGIELEQMPREDSVCQYTIQGDNALEVSDLSLDERFKEKFYVKGDPNLRYYYGLPLQTKQGNNIGALCVVDTEQKVLDPEKKELLRYIANEVVTRLLFLQENNLLRKELDEAKDSNLKVIHDIRGPLTGIIGVADLVERQLSPEQAKSILELVVLIKKSGESLMDLADEIMNNASEKVEPGENEYSFETFIDKLHKLYQPQAISKKLDLQFTGSNAQVVFPKTKLTQIAGNLISNALKFTPEQGSIHVALAVEKVRESQMLTLSVTDTGQGMTPESIDMILEGQKESSNGTGGEAGFGFGMKLVKHLVEKAGGYMTIQSEQDKGTCFKVLIPHI